MVLDEFADMRPEAWYEVIRPSLSDRMDLRFLLVRQKARNHFYDLYAKGLDGDADWQSYQYTTIQGGNVPEQEIEQAKQDLDERTFKQEYEAQFVNYSGIIYYGFSREESVGKIEADHHTLHVGMDFNLDPMSAVVCVRHHDTLLAIDEVVMWGSNTDEMALELRTRYPDKRVIIYPTPHQDKEKQAQAGVQI